MGSFNPQYEKYYKNLRNNSNMNRMNRKKGLNFISPYDFFAKRIIRDLIGVAFLLVFVVLCKLIVIPQTQTVYNYSKKVVNSSIDYKVAIDKIKQIDFAAVNEKITSYIESIKNLKNLNISN